MSEPLSKVLPFALRKLRPISNEEDARRRATWQLELDKRRRSELEDAVSRRGIPRDQRMLSVVYNDKPTRTAMFERVVNRPWNAPGMGDLAFVLGGTGTGKTTGVSWMLARHPLSALYVTAPQCCEYRNTATALLLDAVRTVNLLGIDELGLEAKPSAIVELIIHRFDNGLITVLLGNLTTEQLGERYSDPRLRSRVASLGRSVIIELGDEDLRVQR